MGYEPCCVLVEECVLGCCWAVFWSVLVMVKPLLKDMADKRAPVSQG